MPYVQENLTVPDCPKYRHPAYQPCPNALRTGNIALLCVFCVACSVLCVACRVLCSCTVLVLVFVFVLVFVIVFVFVRVCVCLFVCVCAFACVLASRAMRSRRTQSWRQTTCLQGHRIAAYVHGSNATDLFI